MILWALVAISLLASPSAGQIGSSSTCSDGICIATIERTETQMGATIALVGSPEALTALNHEGGWEVWDCVPYTVEQTVYIACSNPAGCDDLYNGGAEGTIVKLDKKCTNSEFGVVVAEERAEDQTIPHEVARRLVKRGVETPEVRMVTLKELSEVDGRHGNVSFFIFGSTWGGRVDDLRPHFTRELDTSERHHFRRGAWEILKEIATAFVDTPFGIPPHGTFTSYSPSSIDTQWKTFKNGTVPLDFERSLELFERELFCSSYSKVRAGATVEASVSGSVGVAVVAAGVVWPPVVTKFQILTDVSADFESSVKLGVTGEGTIASGDMNLFEVGVPGLNVPGVINIGPAFRVVANAGGTFGLDMDADVTLKFKLNHWISAYPNTIADAPDLVPQETEEPLVLAVSERTNAYGSIEAHVIAKLEISIDAFAGTARAAVFMALDSYANAKVGVKHELEGSLPGEKPKPKEVVKPTRKSIAGRPLPGLPIPKRTDPVEITDPRPLSQHTQHPVVRGLDLETNSTICGSLVLGLHAHLGVEGNLFEVIKQDYKHTVWKREWALFQKCIEDLLGTKNKGEDTKETPHFPPPPPGYLDPSEVTGPLPPDPFILDPDPFLNDTPSPWRKPWKRAGPPPDNGQNGAGQCESGSFNATAGACQLQPAVAASSEEAEAEEEKGSDRVAAPIECAASQVSTLTQVYSKIFKPLTAVVLPNGTPKEGSR